MKNATTTPPATAAMEPNTTMRERSHPSRADWSKSRMAMKAATPRTMIQSSMLSVRSLELSSSA